MHSCPRPRHHFRKYAYRYLAEIQFRLSLRYELRAILNSLRCALVRAPRRPKSGNPKGMRVVVEDSQLTGRAEINDTYLGVSAPAAWSTVAQGTRHPLWPRYRPQRTACSIWPACRLGSSQMPPWRTSLPCHTALSLTSISDSLNCFRVTAAAGAVQNREYTGGGRAVVLTEMFVAVNTLTGNVQTAIADPYHAIKFATYAYRYPAKAQFRFQTTL